MKKHYILTLLLFSAFVSFGQSWKYINAAGEDVLWTESTNWSAGVLPVNGDLIGIWNPTLSVILDTDFTANIFQNNGTRATDFTLKGTNTLTLDVATKTNFGENTAKAIRHWTTSPTKLVIDCPIVVNNSSSEDGPVYDDWSSFKIEGDPGNILEFSANSSLALNGFGGTGLYGDNLGEFVLNGSLSGDQVLGVGTNTKVTFGADFTNNGFTGGVTVYSGANLIVNTANNVKFSNKKLQANGSGTVTLNSEFVLGKEISVQGTSHLTININANQSMSHITFTNSANGSLTLNIDDSVTSIGFWKNHAKDWGTATLNINGYKEGIINFGANDSPKGLTDQQLDQIKINGQTPSEDFPLSIDATGHLVGASDLVLGSKSYETFDFSVYPNPAKDVINVQTAEKLAAIVLYDMLGNQVMQSNSQQINVQALSSGVYILKAFAENGKQATQKIVVE